MYPPLNEILSVNKIETTTYFPLPNCKELKAVSSTLKRTTPSVGRLIDGCMTLLVTQQSTLC